MASPQKKFGQLAKVLFSPNRRLRKWRILILIAILTGGAATLWMRYYVYPFLALSRPIETPNTVIVEGWLPFHALQSVFNESIGDTSVSVIVTGASRGHAVFTLGGHPQSEWAAHVEGLGWSTTDIDSLFVTAWGNSIEESFGHVEVYVNEEQIGEFEASNSGQSFAWALPDTGYGPVQRVSLRMKNTQIAPREGIRQVYIQRVALGSLELPLFGPHSFYSFSVAGGNRLEVSQEENVAVVAGNILEQLGLPKRRLVVLPYEGKQGYRTLEGARTVANWIQQSGNSGQSIRLYSQAAHARRSYEIYRKTLPDSIQLGVTALPDYRYDENWISNPVGRKLVLEQLFKYFFYKIVFIR